MIYDGLFYEVAESKHTPDEWVVEAINHPPKGDGEIYAAIFSGPYAMDRAVEYAMWKNGIKS